MKREYPEFDDDVTVTLNLDGGEDLECRVLTILSAGGREYIVLQPIDSDDYDEGECFFYRYTEKDGCEPEIGNITDDEEYDRVADAFDEYLDTIEYDEIIATEEEE